MASLSRLYPLHGLPRQGQLWSWISFDVANQSFTLIINTLLFSIFFKQVVVQDPTRDDFLWSIVSATSMLLVVAASPIAGAIADGKAWKKRALLLTGLGCAALTCALGLIEPGMFWLAVLLYIPANFFFQIGENFLASFLPELARPQDYGRVSGFSWGVAYASALLQLLLVAGTMALLGMQAPEHWRPFFVAAGVWFLVFVVPTLLFLKERAAPPQASAGGVLRMGFTRLAQSVHNTRKHRDLIVLLVASLFYGAAMNVIIFFASIIASEYGFRDTQLVIFVAVITVSGVVGTLVPTFYQDRIGHRLTTVLLLVLWLLTAIGLTLYTWHAGRVAAAGGVVATWPLWIFGNLLGLGLGSLGAANRAFVGALAPPSRSAEVFGLWGMVFKFAAVLTIPFGYVKDAVGTPAALAVLTGFVVVGLAITMLVNEQRGIEAARENPAPPPPLVPPPPPAASAA